MKTAQALPGQDKEKQQEIIQRHANRGGPPQQDTGSRKKGDQPADLVIDPEDDPAGQQEPGPQSQGAF